MKKRAKHQVRLKHLLAVITLTFTVAVTATGCGSKTVATPPAGSTATDGITNDPQATVAAKMQAAQQAAMAQREQQLMRQAHPGTAPPAKPQ